MWFGKNIKRNFFIVIIQVLFGCLIFHKRNLLLDQSVFFVGQLLVNEHFGYLIITRRQQSNRRIQGVRIIMSPFVCLFVFVF